MKRRILCLIVLIISLCAKNAHAVSSSIETVKQDSIIVQQELQKDTSTLSPVTLDQDQIREYKNDEEFNYVEALPEDNWWTRFKQWAYNTWNSFIRWIFGSDEVTGFTAVLLKLLPYIFVIGLLFLLVWVFSKMDTGDLLLEKKQTAQAFMSDDEELIKHEDIQLLINKAIDSGNYRLAIRFYYLLSLQKMSGKELIEWQVQKTNHEYIYEVEDVGIRNQFRLVTDIYDYIWYGNFEVDKQSFEKAQSTFVTLTNKL
ncbi:DUF4129 domain-containing protein [Dokdonia sp.]|uniref:DUF4129 domain-containing protein n=1 Tax=Dokdonia sp. TaxID=2024995 RepID=UPI003264A901